MQTGKFTLKYNHRSVYVLQMNVIIAGQGLKYYLDQGYQNCVITLLNPLT